MKMGAKPKFKKDKGEQAQPGESVAPPPPPPPSEEIAPPPQPPGDQGPAPGKRKHNKDNGKPPQEACPEGTVPLEDGSCATPQ
jgi:hypothetical protein